MFVYFTYLIISNTALLSTTVQEHGESNFGLRFSHALFAHPFYVKCFISVLTTQHWYMWMYFWDFRMYVGLDFLWFVTSWCFFLWLLHWTFFYYPTIYISNLFVIYTGTHIHTHTVFKNKTKLSNLILNITLTKCSKWIWGCETHLKNTHSSGFHRHL